MVYGTGVNKAYASILTIFSPETTHATECCVFMLVINSCTISDQRKGEKSHIKVNIMIIYITYTLMSTNSSILISY